MKKILLIVIMSIMCYVGVANASSTTHHANGVSKTPTATGYAIDYDYDGTFDRFYGSPRDDDVSIGLLSWGETRGYAEFSIGTIRDTITRYDIPDWWEEGDEFNDEWMTILHLDRIYLNTLWYSGSSTESAMSIYGYEGDGIGILSHGIYQTNLLIASGIGDYESVDVTDFVISLMHDDADYAGFTMVETRDGVIKNYYSEGFELDFIYIPEPMTILILAIGIVYMRNMKI